MDKFTFSILLLFMFSMMTAQHPNQLLLKNYRPHSIYKIPVTKIDKPKFPIIDMHSHAYANSKKEIAQWVATMDYFGIEKTIILTGATGAKFDSLVQVYGKYPKHFELWCGIDFSDSDKADWSKRAAKELERCHQMGAKGVGEITDKGLGLYNAFGGKSKALRIDGKKMKPVLEKLAALKMPINMHVAEPIWMYEPIDSTNDGLMNASNWRIKKETENILLHQALVESFSNAVKAHPQTTFIACHFLNCSYDLSIVGDLLDQCPNLYTDISARYAETSPVPRYVKKFYKKYQDRIFYGTDMGFGKDMYRITFRILETEDEHFYHIERFAYHWALNGFGLSDEILRKVYRENAVRIFGY